MKLSTGAIIFTLLLFSQIEGGLGEVDINNAGDLGGRRDHICAICSNVSAELTKILSDPKTEEFVVLLAEEIACKQLPDPLLAKCKRLVKEYVPRVFSILKENVTLSSLCERANICVPKGTAAPSSFKFGSSLPCGVCIEAAKEILHFLKSGTTQNQTLDLLHKSCNDIRLPKLKSECIDFVDTNFPRLASLLESVTPEEACQVAGQCVGQTASPLRGIFSAVSSMYKKTSKLVRKSSQECLACEFLISQARKKLRDPKNQAKLEEYLEELCTKAPEYTAECQEAVDEYLPEIFDNVDVVVNPLKVCTKLRLCNVTSASNAELTGGENIAYA